MKTFEIVLNEIDKIKTFVNVVNKYDFDVEIKSGKYIINAKSIMGIFSLDLSKPMTLCIDSDDSKSISMLDKDLLENNFIA